MKYSPYVRVYISQWLECIKSAKCIQSALNTHRLTTTLGCLTIPTRLTPPNHVTSLWTLKPQTASCSARMDSLPTDHFVKQAQFTPTTHRDVYPAIDPTNASLSQAGKVVIITGASQGLGAQVRSA
jgi:hypothetical protein